MAETKLKKTFWLAIAVASVGSGFQHGFHTSSLNNLELHVKEWLRYATETEGDEVLKWWSTVNAFFCVGGLIGGALTAPFVDQGRKKGLVFNGFFQGIGISLFIIMNLKASEWILIAARFFVGINCGLHAGLAPMYINEISPVHIRGAMGTLYQLNITIFILLGMILGLEPVMGSAQQWKLNLVLIPLIFLVYQQVGLFFCPESPKYYMEKDEEEKAIACAARLYTDTTMTLEELKHINATKAPRDIKILDMFKVKKFRNPLIIIMVLMAAQQFSGINAVVFYSTDIFKTSEMGEEIAQYSTVGMGIVNVLSTIVSVWLMEAKGRKFLLLVSFGGMILFSVALLICLHFVAADQKSVAVTSIVCVYLYIICFAVGAGPIPWLLGPELFSTAARPMAISMAVPANWFCNAIVVFSFPALENAMGPMVFIIFIFFQVLALLFVIYFVPETKNKTIDEIVSMFE